MTHSHKTALLLLCSFLAFSCSFSAENDTYAYSYAPLRMTGEVSDLTPYISDIELIKVGDGDVVIPGISKVLFSEPVVLLSGGVVYSSSPNFKKIQKVGNVGRGPGEYLSVKDIAINSKGDEIWCMDVLNSVLRYSLGTLDYLGSIDFQKDGREYARAMIPQEDNNIALYTPNPDGNIPHGREPFYCVSYFSPSGKRIDRDIPWTQYNVMAGFSCPVSVAARGKYVLSPESSNIAYVFDNKGNYQMMEFDFGSKWIPSNFFNPKHGDPIQKVGELFEMDCYKLISAIFMPGDNVYFHAYGKDSSSWNFFLSKEGSQGIRWKSVGVSSPPICAIGADGDYLYFQYDDYGLADVEKDPLKQSIINKYGIPEDGGVSYLIKVKLNVE